MKKKKKKNFVVHGLAKEATKQALNRIWVEEVLDSISEKIISSNPPFSSYVDMLKKK
jgi:hypothetical protein